MLFKYVINGFRTNVKRIFTYKSCKTRFPWHVIDNRLNKLYVKCENVFLKGD